MNEAPYLFQPSLNGLLTEVPSDSILSRTVYNDNRVKVTLFGFAAGQELTEHTAAQPAVIHFLAGEADLRLGDDPMQASAGSWAHMPAELRHSIRARTPVAMLLYLFKEPA